MTAGADAAGRKALPAVVPYLWIVVVGIAAFMFPNLSPTGKMLSLATTTAVFAVGGSGLGFLWGQSGQLSLAHAAIYGLGSYAAAIVAKQFGLGFLESLPFSIVVGLIAGGLVALPSLRTKGHYFIILTFAIGEVLAVVEQRWDSLTGGANGIVTLPGSQTVFGYALAQRADYYRLTIFFAVVVWFGLRILMRSRWGTILRGMRENAELAASLGVNVPVHRVIAFAISGAIAGLGGQLYLYQVKFIAPALFTTQASITFLLITLLGGKTYLFGPTVGAIAYFFLSEYLGLPPVMNQIAFGALLIVMILMAPDGLLSLGERIKHLRRHINQRRNGMESINLDEGAVAKEAQNL